LEPDLDKNTAKIDLLLREAALIFWDFDGVIKDSLDVKAKAFSRLFQPYGPEIVSRIIRHHESNGGVSRFDKIPIYLRWAGQRPTPALLKTFCDRYSKSVFQAVIDSPWVPGVLEYLARNSSQQYFVLVTATPQEEIERILVALKLTDHFREVYGAPTNKSSCIRDVLERQKIAPDQALMIGDAETDLKAAQSNSVPFILRCTPFNLTLQTSHCDLMFHHLNDE
jgi:phosphoglycolate phosphatase-like HAD superfamily hydrolase